MENKGSVPVLIKRDGIILSIALTVLTILGIYEFNIPGFLAGMAWSIEFHGGFMFLIYSLMDIVPLVLEIILCIGAWRLTFGSDGGGGMMRFVYMFYRVLAYIGVGIVGIFALIGMYLIIRYGSFASFLVAALMFGVLIGALFLVAYFYIQATVYVRDIQARIRIRDYNNANVVKSSMGTLLMLLAILKVILLVLELLNFNSMGAVDMFMDFFNGLGAMDDMLDVVMDSFTAARAISVYVVTSIVEIFICIYGFIFTRNHARITLLG